MEDLRLSVENAMQHLDEQEISKMTEKQLVSNLLTVRKEIAQLNLNSIELVDAYLQARANSVIKANANVSYTIIDENVTVGKNAVIGVEKDPTAEIVVLGRGITIGDGVKVLEGQKHENDILA